MALAIEPSGIRLHPLCAADWREIALLFEDPDYSWFPYRRSRTQAEARFYALNAESHWSEYGFGTWGVREADGRLAGTVGCTTETTFSDFAWNLGIRLGASLRGRHFALPLLKLVTSALPDCVDAERVGASIEAGHRVSLSLFESGLGMRRLRSVRHPSHGSMHILVVGLRTSAKATS